jgi:hypothetical protein
MMKWIIAAVMTATFAVGGAAYATKDHKDAVGVKGCKACHEGSPKDKKFNDKLVKHLAKVGKTDAATCKACHQGNNKPSKQP